MNYYVFDCLKNVDSTDELNANEAQPLDATHLNLPLIYLHFKTLRTYLHTREIFV
jgi:hypothetical protein